MKFSTEQLETGLPMAPQGIPGPERCSNGQPALAHERTADYFQPEQPVLFLERASGRLLEAIITSVQPYSEPVRIASPGLVRLRTEQEPVIIVDIDSNRIIPTDAWEMLRTDASFREAWVASCPETSMPDHEAVLKRAIHDARLEATTNNPVVRTEPRRARLRRRRGNPAINIAAFSAEDELLTSFADLNNR